MITTDHGNHNELRILRKSYDYKSRIVSSHNTSFVEPWESVKYLLKMKKKVMNDESSHRW